MGQRPVHGWENEVDDFWDLSEMLPKKKMPQKPRAAAPEATRIRISYGDAQEGEPIPPRTKEKPPARAEISEYTPSLPLITRVRILPWPSDFNFYLKFRADALRFAERTHAPCDYVYFFSYMPQYDQMTSDQMAYYFYWRGEARAGHFIKTDNSYLFLYIYEIINLPDKIPPKEGAALLSALWAAYRASFRYLDQYLGEWLCDYCLLYRVEPNRALLADFIGDACGTLSFPEFYAERGSVPFSLLCAVSAYDYRKSKYYAENAEAFDTHIPAAACEAMERVVLPHLDEYDILPIKLCRDTFSGAVACRGIKYKLEITCRSLKRAYSFRQLAASLIRYCENQLRAVFAIKSRFAATGLDDAVKEAVGAYFDRFYPARQAKKRAPEESYLAWYEPRQSGPASIENALKIEEDAWKTAELLEGSDLDLPQAPAARESELSHAAPKPLTTSAGGVSPNPQTETDETKGGENEQEALWHALHGEAREALESALRGGFRAFCRARGRMAEQLQDEINECAAAVTGDIVLEGDGTVIPEYREALCAAWEALHPEP